MKTGIVGIAMACAAAMALVGCGGAAMNQPAPQTNQNQTFTAAQVFSPKVGDVWHFKNAYGDSTTVSIEAAPNDAAGTTGNHIILHFTKDADRAYWGINTPGAEDHFLMLQLPDGSWRGVADIPNFPDSCSFCAGHTSATLNWHPVDGMPTPYLIVPSSVMQGQTVNIPTEYHWFELWDTTTTDDIANPPMPNEQGQDMGIAIWETDFSVEEVDTPLYKGLAAVSHQFEGSCGPKIFCNEEKWFFAPGVGLVEIQPLGNIPVPVDPNLTIKRVQ